MMVILLTTQALLHNVAQYLAAAAARGPAEVFDAAAIGHYAR